MAELIRGKSGRVFGNLIGLLTVMKGLPLAYNKDMQEDKEGVFDAVKTIIPSIKIMTGMIETLTVNKEKMQKATEDDFQTQPSLPIIWPEKAFRSARPMPSSETLSFKESNHILAFKTFRLKSIRKSIPKSVKTFITTFSQKQPSNAENHTGRQVLSRFVIRSSKPKTA